MIDEQRLRPHHIGYRHDGKIESIRLAGVRIDRGGAGRAHAAAKDVWANDEESVGVERAPGTNHRLPPSWPASERMPVGDVLIAGQGVTNQESV